MMIRLLRLLALSITACFIQETSLHAQCFTSNETFREGEEISYEVSYSWGPIWVDAGLVTFSVTKEKYNGKDAFHLKSTGKTYSTYDLFFKVRDSYDSWIDPETFRSLEFRRMVYEGGYTLLNTLNYDYMRQKIYSHTKTNDNPVRADTMPLAPCTFDMLSAVYFTRTLKLESLKPFVKVPVSVVIDDAKYLIYIKSLGVDTVENKDGKKYRCIKFTAKMVQGTIFKGDEDVVIWVTDDENRIPVYIEAKIIVGTVKAYLKDASGLRNRMKALIK
jgi:hypothetical protein